MENLLNVTTREGLRSWLQSNGTTEKYCWVIVSIISKPDTLLYLDAVEEALCFGWIDGIRKKIRKINLSRDCHQEQRKVHGQN